MEAAPRPKHEITYKDVLLLVFGVILPIVTLAVEMALRLCQVIFDPIPSIWHVVLIMTVPLGNFLVWRTYVNRGSGHPGLVGFANGMAIGVSLIYTIIFVPLLVVSLIAIFFMGIGVLCWAPLLSFLSAIFGRFWLKGAAPQAFAQSRMATLFGFVAAIVCLFGAELPSSLTRIGMQMAASPDTSARGVQFLRAAGDRDTMLRMCYDRTGRATDLLGFLATLPDPTTPEEARRIFYRVTGLPFNAAPLPASVWRGSRAVVETDVFELDTDQGGDAVGGIAKGLALTGSQIDASVDADAALAYLQWTLTFKNKSTWQREARMQLALPPGGVVSRLTLWVNGQEKEAAFAARSDVRRAYEQVVRRRRDPVLVTTAGPDRVLVQCFPVPPQEKGEMKIRLGITAPLLLEGTGRALLPMPRLLERNFQVACGHSTWIESHQPLASRTEALVAEHPGDKLHALRGTVPHDELEEGVAVRADRAPDVRAAWSDDILEKGKEIVLQTFSRTAPVCPKRLVLVIDGSGGMDSRRKGISDALREVLHFVPDTTETIVFFASDNLQVLSPLAPDKAREHLTRAVNQLGTLSFVGGQDNVAALEKAWEVAAKSPNSAILWIHAAQPALLSPATGLRQRLSRRASGPQLYDLQVVPGPNRIVEALDGLSAVHSLPSLSGITEDLKLAVCRWYGLVDELRPVRTRTAAAQAPTRAGGAVKTSSHLARLWAHDRILKDLANNKLEDAVSVATAYQLVTPVSGAVVLETKDDFQRAGLKPVDESTVPTIPEPETWLLLAAAGAFLLVFLWRSRRAEVRV
ncbi:MAG TPA: VIT domain-containing protein [Candidatus Obscuribacterales bacterium]